MNEGEVGGELVARPRHRRAEQPGLEFVVGKALGKLPIDAGRAGQRDVLARRALGDLERAANLAVAQPCLQVQAQCLSDSAHGDSVRGHRIHPQKAVSLDPFKKSLARPLPSAIPLKQRPRSV